MDIDIGLLRLEILDAAGLEHRIAPIAARAGEILAERLDERAGRSKSPAGGRVGSVTAPPMQLDLSAMGDELAARSIANTCLAALLPELGL